MWNFEYGGPTISGFSTAHGVGASDPCIVQGSSVLRMILVFENFMRFTKFHCKRICKILIFITFKCVLQKRSGHSRLGVIYNPTSKIDEENTTISRGILTAFLTLKNSFLRNFLRKLVEEKTAAAIYSGNKIKTLLTEVSSYLFEIIDTYLLHISKIFQCAWRYVAKKSISIIKWGS